MLPVAAQPTNRVSDRPIGDLTLHPKGAFRPSLPVRPDGVVGHAPEGGVDDRRAQLDQGPGNLAEQIR
jgi:hypothetical protein